MGTLVGILIVLALAIIVGVDAEKRGMSPFWWGLLTFVFGLLGAIIYLIARKPRLPVDPKTES